MWESKGDSLFAKLCLVCYDAQDDLPDVPASIAAPSNPSQPAAVAYPVSEHASTERLTTGIPLVVIFRHELVWLCSRALIGYLRGQTRTPDQLLM